MTTEYKTKALDYHVHLPDADNDYTFDELRKAIDELEQKVKNSGVEKFDIQHFYMDSVWDNEIEDYVPSFCVEGRGLVPKTPAEIAAAAKKKEAAKKAAAARAEKKKKKDLDALEALMAKYTTEAGRTLNRMRLASADTKEGTTSLGPS